VGRWNALQPTVLELPRVPTNIGFDTSQPAELIAEYQVDVSKGVPVDYATVIDQSSTPLLRQLLNGSNDPWMFHQANTRDYDGRGHSLLSDLLDATLAKYAAAATFPILSPTMDELAQRVAARTELEGAGLTATIDPGVSITLAVASAATVPVTGLCTPAAEQYGGQTISRVALNAGQSVTLALTGCNVGAGTGGSPGAGGGSGAAGAGGMTAMTGAGGGLGPAGTGAVAGRQGGAAAMGGAGDSSGPAGDAGSGVTPGQGGSTGAGAAGGTNPGAAGGPGLQTGVAGSGAGGRPVTGDAGADAAAGDGGLGAASEAGPRGHGAGPSADQGCACAVKRSDPAGPGALLLLPALAAVRRSRRRR
ncbi:MAG: MYXO-CTERM sorting domain-containing protein, partial [Pseudomonadota bacterium]